jgi:hypothetical protein
MACNKRKTKLESTNHFGTWAKSLLLVKSTNKYITFTKGLKMNTAKKYPNINTVDTKAWFKTRSLYCSNALTTKNRLQIKATLEKNKSQRMNQY